MNITPQDKNQIGISVVVPICNEEKTIDILYKRIRDVLGKLGENNEIIFIDDGSTDGSAEILKQLSILDKMVKVFKFLSNQGQHKAIEKGFMEAKGRIIVTMDSDLQHDPYDIPKLIGKLNENFDIVCGWRKDRKDRWYKIVSAKAGNFIQRKITGLNLHDMGCGMRAYRRDIVKNIVFTNKYEIGLLPYILSKRTNRITEIEIAHNKRIYGRSHYNLSYIFGTIYCYTKLLLTKK